MSRLAENMGIQWSFQIKKYFCLGIFALFGIIVYNIFSFFSVLNQEIKLRGHSFKMAQVVVLSPMDVNEIKRDVKSACQEDVFTGKVKHPEECAEAKKVFEIAMAKNAKIQAGTNDLFDQGVQTSDYYKGWIKAMGERPFYWFVLVVGFIFTGSILVWMTMGYVKNQKGEPTNAL